MGPDTKLKKRLKQGVPGINRLDKIVKQHNNNYSKSKNLQDKWKSFNKLRGHKTMTECIVKRIMQAKKSLKL